MKDFQIPSTLADDQYCVGNLETAQGKIQTPWLAIVYQNLGLFPRSFI